MITLTIPEATPSLNEWNKGHWSVYTKMRRHWSMLMMEAKNNAHVRGGPLLNARVNIIRHGIRALDTDNAVGGCKVVIDSLRDHRLITDDDPAHLTLTVEQVKVERGDYPATVIQISAI
jgi:hypothetical protein